MRLMVGKRADTVSLYGIRDDQAFDLTSSDPALGPDLSTLLAMHDAKDRVKRIMDQAQGSIPVTSIEPQLPVARPGKIICLGLNYADHAKEGGYDVPDYPALFMRGVTSMIPAQAPMIRPRCSDRLDYEAELMVIIGKTGRHIQEQDAFDHVFGYTIFNDGSVRDYQRKTHQWTPGKNFDGTGPIGPVVVTPDELPAGALGLKIESRINGEVMQSANTSDMIWQVPRTLATLSEYCTLEAGDLIAMGTPPGVGHARTPPRWLAPGDVVEIEIEGIGICRNPVADEVLSSGRAA